MSMGIRSQAMKIEGSETISQESRVKVDPKRQTPLWGEDIVRSSSKGEAVRKSTVVMQRITTNNNENSYRLRPFQGCCLVNLMPRVNFVNCWKPLRAMEAKTKLETIIVNAKNIHRLGNQQLSSCKMEKVQRSGDIPHRPRVRSKREDGRNTVRYDLFCRETYSGLTGMV